MRKNKSKQRLEVMRIVEENRNHLTADEIYQLLKQNNSTASISTVYRNLHDLVEMGAIICVTTPNGIQHYDGDISDHHHAVCTKCAKIIDIPIRFDSLQSQVKNFNGFEMNNYQIVMQGICQECARKERGKENG